MAWTWDGAAHAGWRHGKTNVTPRQETFTRFLATIDVMLYVAMAALFACVTVVLIS